MRLRPSYFVEPQGNWGEGRVELVEMPTQDETNDNIVASLTPKDPPEPNKPFSYAYRLTASLNLTRLSPNGRTVNTYQTTAAALGSAEPVTPGSRRFIIDFAGGELPYYALDPSLVEVVPSTSQGRIVRSFHTEPLRQGLPRGDRRQSRRRAIDRLARLSADGAARPHRDLDLSLAR